MKTLVIALLLLLSLPLVAKELTPYRHGYEQGRQAGAREGRERVDNQGAYQGEGEGYAAGATFGQQQLINQAYAQGLALGQTDGAAQGSQQGREAGLAKGQEDGDAQGQSKARTSADQAAKLAVADRATSDGQARGAAANPQADGLMQGRQAGLARAKTEANAKDFARARDDYRTRQFTTAPKGRSEVRQAPLAVAPNAWTMHGDGSTRFGGGSCPGPDYRHLRYGSDNEEYQRGYREGYGQGVRDGFNQGYDRQYRYAYDRAYAVGVAQAQVVNLQATVDEAYQMGFDKAHAIAYGQAEKAAHQAAYTPAFEAAYSSTYAALYPVFEAEHYKAIEEATFAAIYAPAFQTAFATHEQASFEENYPEQAKLAYDQGWKVEAKDFVDRPVRVLQAWLTPTDVEGMQLLSIKVRNFSSQTVSGNRIRVSLGSQTSRLYHPLPANCEMTVTGLIRLRGELPDQVDLFAVIENSTGHPIPLGTIPVAATPPG